MVDREGAVTENMLTIHALTTQLRSQTLTESQANLSQSSQDEIAAKIRHHSEPHPPASILSDPCKKVKIITFHEGVPKDNMALTSIFLSAEANLSGGYDSANSNPPNKRQCRSMSIPNDGELHSRWLQTQARSSHLHRPLAVRPNSGGSRAKSHQLGHHRSSQLSRGLPPVWSSLGTADSSTPPESPRSRPSSASSGYFDSPLASLSNLNKNRCESLQTLPSMEGSSRHGSGDSSRSLRVISAKSMPSVADPSAHLSPSKQLLLRCQSQPCVIHERRCGVKRRRNDEQRPSINFNKMTETAIGKGVKEQTSALTNRLTSPLKIRLTARYGPIFPDRVLQTIASSPQDATYISAPAASSCVGSPPSHHPVISGTSSPVPSMPSAPTHHTNAEDSDSGCSTTDDELCDITNKMAASESATKSVCNHKLSPGCASSGCTCTLSDEMEHNLMFAMEPAQDGELDIDMIENN